MHAAHACDLAGYDRVPYAQVQHSSCSHINASDAHQCPEVVGLWLQKDREGQGQGHSVGKRGC